MEEIKKIHLRFDSDIYCQIIKTGRLLKRETGLPKLLSKEESEINSDKQVSPTFVFTNNYVFDTNHLSKILDVHTPLKANSYYDKCENNVLTLRFYKI